MQKACQARLDDGSTRCPRTIPNIYDFCKAHFLESRASYKRYKTLSKSATRLKDTLYAEFRDPRAIKELENVKRGIKTAEAYLEAAERELKGRVEHKRRFYPGGASRSSPRVDLQRPCMSIYTPRTLGQGTYPLHQHLVPGHPTCTCSS